MNLRITTIYAPQHFDIKFLWIIPLSIFTTVTLTPNDALAFEASLSNAVKPQMTAEVELKGRPGEPRLLTGRDPYLAEAINNLPKYDFTHSGNVASASSPVTEEASWPEPEQTRLAFSPVQTTSVPQPDQEKSLTLEGEASYYSRAGCLGCNPGRIMANGQPLNDSALTMAIGADKKHLVGRQAKVTSLTTGQSTQVTITDTGGFYRAKYGNRVADLTIAAKQAIGMHGGVGQVRVEIY
jgi:rare lipoprotein A (peptidoglycan hydrolase)